MSVTKPVNQRELISKADINSERFRLKPSQCSCTDCDSIACFDKRNKAIKGRCQCSLCRDLRACSTLPNKGSPENTAKLESATKKIIREVVTRETMESLKRVTETMYEYGNNENFGLLKETQSKQGSKKVITNPTKGQISDRNGCCKKSFIADSHIGDIRNSDRQSLISQNEIKVKKRRPELSPISQCQINDEIQCCMQKPIAQVPSTDVNQPQKEDTATKLSAQVMNVPYDELDETVPSSHELTELNPLSKLNIFKRIKEIYDACSCKVCECISSKSRYTGFARDLRDDFCKCEPCNCQDCVKSRRKIEENIKRIPHSGCPCIRCDRKDCRGIAKNASEPQACDCNPSDCMLYPENLSKSCKCEPCQCTKCKLLENRTTKTVRLGQIDEIIQREICNCSPCECIECKNIYGRTNPIIMCTTSTEMSRFRNYCQCKTCRTERCQFGEIESCTCERQNRTMRKPFENNLNDYDIRTVIVENNGPFHKHEQNNFETQNTVALCASIKSSYPNNSCKTDICKCTDCECIACTAKNSMRSDRQRSRPNIMSVHSAIRLPTSIMDACKCKPCECEICSRKQECVENVALESACTCEVCDCLNCDRTTFAPTSFRSTSFGPYMDTVHRNQHYAKPIRIMDRNKNCGCNPCDCKNCKDLFSCSSSVKFYSTGKTTEKKTSRRVRKVMLITPSASENKFTSQNTHVSSVSSKTFSPKQSIEALFRHNLSSCPVITHNNYTSMSNFSNIKENQALELYNNKQEYKVISGNNVHTDIFFNAYDDVLESRSFKCNETPSINYLRNFPQTSFKTHKLFSHKKDTRSETQHFNEFHETHDISNLNGSQESLPVFWTCRNEMLHPTSFSRNIRITCKRDQPIRKVDLTDSLNKNNHAEKKQAIISNVVPKNEGHEYQNWLDKARSKGEDVFTEYFKNSLGGNYKYSSDDERGEVCQESHKHADSFSTTVNNSYVQHRTSVINNSEVSIDYERATRVLWEAKAFSSKLIKMLDSFETANKQFQSASQKFKVLHESLLNINESEMNNRHNANFERMPKSSFNDTFEVITECHPENAEQTRKNENEAEKEYEHSSTFATVKPSEVEHNLQCMEEQITSSNDNTFEQNYMNGAFIKTDVINSHQNETSTEAVRDSNLLHESKSTSNSLGLTQNKSSKYLSNNTLEVLGSYNLDPYQSDSYRKLIKDNKVKIVTNNLPKHTRASAMTRIDSVLGNSCVADDTEITDNKEKKVEQLTKEIQNQSWKIFNKNLYLNSCPVVKRTIFESSPLELDTKEAIRAISLLSANNENYSKLSRPNEALVNLQNEVSGLLNMPILQSGSQDKNRSDSDAHLFPRSKLDLDLKSMSSASSQTYDRLIEKADKEVYFNTNTEPKKSNSYDDLKPQLISLRRVSDHTVLVKWQVPKRLKDVQGYELLVDGRAVQQVQSPARGLAVLTCLPHAARVLLTVRTLAARCPPARAPAASVVYRPRK